MYSVLRFRCTTVIHSFLKAIVLCCFLHLQYPLLSQNNSLDPFHDGFLNTVTQLFLLLSTQSWICYPKYALFGVEFAKGKL